MSIRIDIGNTDLGDIAPTEYRADAVITVTDRHGALIRAIVLEVLLNRDPDKPYTWPVYLTNLRARLRCPVNLLIIAADPAVAAWCARPIELGDQGFTLTPWVIGPGWAEKAGQEVVLAICLDRRGFDQILAAAVHSSFKPAVYPSREDWKRQVARSDVRLQWDPDHDPHGNKLQRRAIQLGLRGPMLRRYALEWCLGIEDISARVRAQREHVRSGRLDLLETPVERVYRAQDPSVASHLGLAELPKGECP